MGILLLQETGAAARNTCSMKRGDVMGQTAEPPGHAGFFHYKTRQTFWSDFSSSSRLWSPGSQESRLLGSSSSPLPFAQGWTPRKQWILADFVNKWILRNVCEHDWESSIFLNSGVSFLHVTPRVLSYECHVCKRFQFSSVAQLCLTLCNPMDCSTSGFPVHHQLPELAQTHLHGVGDAIRPSHPLLSPSWAFNLS